MVMIMNRVVLGNGILRTAPARLRYFFLFAIVSGTTFIILSYHGFTDEQFSFDTQAFSYEDTGQEQFTIKTKGCSIAALHPLDPSVRKFVKYPDTVKPCPNEKTPLLDSNHTHIWLKTENARFYNVTGRHKIKCCYRSFFRPLLVKDVSSSNLDNRVEYKKCQKFTDIIEARDEFVNVMCYEGVRMVYEQFFLFAIDKELSLNNKVHASKNNTDYNVIVIGIDAVSRLNFYRTMPKTLNFLKDKKAIELLGYNKVGDNTFPNIIPMLMGIRDSELKKTCVPNSKLTYFDNCPFVWEWYKQAGFYTALAEDSSNLGTFNYLKDGFIRSPTDYYIHTFINEAEKNVGNNKDFNCFLCMNNKYFYTVLLDYIEHLLIKLRTSKLFGFFWEVTMTHDYLNYPMVMDYYYETFFKRLDALKVLDNTFIFLVSDHGIRWGNIRATKQGRLEERLPFVHILVPPSFKDKYREAYVNLKLNSRRLTTPFNIHSTLNDLVDLKGIENSSIQLRKLETYWNDRNISLFLPIPSNRTCSMADIDDHWCTCHRGRRISITSSEAVEAAARIIEELNKLLNNYEMCARLKLAEILDATELEAGIEEKNEVSWREFMIVIRTNPSNAVFEATIRHDGQTWTLIGTASRLNLYGSQSHCVSDSLLKLYCYCL
ncbi:uncharacterized protein LOC123707312 [Pieris brassicae]|uniref:uncharacterized protein LOC123707312 n=1 Tax=Pieris brassicae TaxID=7116 RepID=UPI001E65F935|nr:uncharacterized protein LOC123707312 [Pieris brassicae]